MHRDRGPVRPSGRLPRRATAVALVGALSGLLLGATASMGADSGTVDAQVTVAQAAACLELSTSSVGFGTLALGAEDASGTPGITISNCGDGDATVFASGTNASGSNASWNLDDSAATCADTLGADAYHLALATPLGAAIATLSTENKEVGTLAGAATADHVARISTACPGSTGAGQVMTMHINYLATNVETPPIVLEPLTADQPTAAAAASFLLPPSKDYDIAANCAGSTPVACPGGVPSNPLPQVQVQASNVNTVAGAGAGSFNSSATLKVATLQAIPVTITGVGCSVTVDSANGANPTVSGTAVLQFQSYPDPVGQANYIAVNNVAITGVDTADITITGSLTCQLADAFKSSFIPMLTDQIESYIEGNVCGGATPGTFVACPPLP